jgi:hypothetical protein
VHESNTLEVMRAIETLTEKSKLYFNDVHVNITLQIIDDQMHPRPQEPEFLLLAALQL